MKHIPSTQRRTNKEEKAKNNIVSYAELQKGSGMQAMLADISVEYIKLVD